VKYNKPALSFNEQAQLLIDRGLIVSKKTELVACLSRVNYYRLSGYLYSFKYVDPSTKLEKFFPNTTLEIVLRRYSFDHKLRLLLMDAVEYIEVAILRTRMIEMFSRARGAFGYINPTSYRSDIGEKQFNNLMDEIMEAVNHSREEFIKRFQRKYEDKYLPIWMIAEMMSFGQLYTMYRYLDRDLQIFLAKQFNLSATVLDSWLHTLNFIRNSCAHHARLWNREIPIRPRIPDHKHHPEWHHPELDETRIYVVFCVVQYLLGYIDPTIHWADGLKQLIVEYPDIPSDVMGFPDSWQDSPLWN
jgi:abortive infection bacteriophage resistance protein